MLKHKGTDLNIQPTPTQQRQMCTQKCQAAASVVLYRSRWRCV